MKNILLVIILGIFLISLASASTFAYNYLDGQTVNPGGNYTINVNNSNFLQGYTPTTLKDWIQGLFNSVYCKLTGCTMTGNISSNSWFNGKFNWTSNDNWNIFNGSVLDFNETKLATVYYNVTQNYTVRGTPAGTLADINTYDGVSYNVTEVSGANGLDFRVNFTGMTEFNQIKVRYKSSMVESHIMYLQIYDTTSSSWENYYVFSSTPDYVNLAFSIDDSEDHLGGGVVQVRFYQADNGNTNHIHQFDWVTITNGFITYSSAEIDPYSWHKSPDEETSNFSTTGNVSVNRLIISNATTTTTHWNMYEDGNGTLVWEKL